MTGAIRIVPVERGAIPICKALKEPQTPILDIEQRLADLPREKQEALERRLKAVLSNRLGDALDDKTDRCSGAIFRDDSKRGIGAVMTLLKEEFLSTPLFIDDIVNSSDQHRLAGGGTSTYSLDDLKSTHQWKRDICTSTPHLDPLIQKALGAAVAADGGYMLGFELDLAETEKQQELVFSIFETNWAKEISRIQIAESNL
jgi:hypothetical protein